MRALLGLGRAGAVGTFGAGEDAARGEEEDVSVGEFLFEFAGETGGGDWGSVVGGKRDFGWGGRVPLLDFVEAGEEGDGDEDDDCFLAVADFELWGGGRVR